MKQLKVHVSVSIAEGGKFRRLYLAKYFTPAKVGNSYTFIRLLKYVTLPKVAWLTIYSKKGEKMKTVKVESLADLIIHL